MTGSSDGRPRDISFAVQTHGAVTGHWSGKNRPMTHTAYPVKYLVVVGTLGTGFGFYGPFDTIDAADAWTLKNLRKGAYARVEAFNDVRPGA